ncbi:MAG: hypothetical protein IJQ82_14850 [Selenomonadaceae bacterium]|nr:hypothetical protein [Selenomonadaceae bacterium]
MAVSVAHMRATKKYRNKTYDTIGFDVPKGKREEFKGKAAELGLSLARFLLIAAESFGKNHAGEMPLSTPKPELTVEQRRLVEEFNQLPLNAQKHFLQAFKAINQSKGGGDNGDN